MMEDVYVECQILLLNFDYFDDNELIRIYHMLECRVWIDWFAPTFSDEGYQILRVLISSYAYEIIDIFFNTVKHFAPFTHVRPIVLSAEDALWIEEQKLNIGAPSMFEYTHSAREGIVYHNKQIASGLPVWAHASWNISSVTVERLKDMLQILLAAEIELYYQKAQNSQALELYFKITLYPLFNVKVDQIKELLGFKRWHMITSYRELEHRFNPDFAGLETLPRLTHDTIPAFLEAIKPHL